MLRPIALIVLLLACMASVAAPPQTLGYQGRLATVGGQPVNGSLGITFRLYAASSGGSALWTELQTGVDVDGGNFAVELGQVTPLPASIWGQQLYLGVQIAGDSEMLPRPALTAAPYALRAAATMQRTVVVSVVGTPTENGAALLAAVAAITDASAESPVAVEIDAGTFDLGTVGLQPPQFTSLIGRGQNATLITSSFNGNTGVLALAATIFLSSNSSVRDLTARNTGVPDGESGSAVGIAALDSASFQLPITNVRLERVTGHSVGPAGSLGQRSGISMCAANTRVTDVVGIGEGGLYATGMRTDCNVPGFVLDGAELYAFAASDGLRGGSFVGGPDALWQRVRVFIDVTPSLLSVHGIRFFPLGSFPTESQGTLRDSSITIRGTDVTTPTNTFRLEGVVTEGGAQIGAMENVKILIDRVRAQSVVGVRLRDPPSNFANVTRLSGMDIRVQGVQDPTLGFGSVMGVHVQGVPPELSHSHINIECLSGGFNSCIGVLQTPLHPGTLLVDNSSITVAHADPADVNASSKAMEIIGPTRIQNSNLLVRQSADGEFVTVFGLIGSTVNLRVTHSSLRATDPADSNNRCLVASPSGPVAEWYGNHLQGVRCDGGAPITLTCAGNTSRGTGFLPSTCP